jgi:hypothetical protein
MIAPQAWHNRIVTQFMQSARGDLILDRIGHLHYREMNNFETGKELPWAQHGLGEMLAEISRDGWMLLPNGAQFILENCPPDNESDLRRLRKLALIYT